ncbi:hypothetical protein [Kosakonia sp.]|uniref:hypothetical protein n=1 Tax=Kosakonia sp. TaxID=1916651 RepID=UPI0028A27315|nr:hypothetical protein [Kosakonia sp.]
MKQWLAKLFGKHAPAQPNTTDGAFPIPWESHRQSLYRFLLPYAQKAGPLPESAQTLPDDDRLQGELRWVAGGMDGAFGHHGGGGNAEETAEQLVSALIAATEQPTPGNLQQLYALLTGHSPIDYIDSLMEKLPQTASLSPQKVHDLMQWLAQESPDRNPVKCAIALLAFFPSEENRARVTTLGLHEEFTLFTAVALHNMLPANLHEDALVTLAKRVQGWGRIQLIERLPEVVSPATRGWLLREGYDNAVMQEYTAWDCATKGQLLAALMQGQPDTALLAGAGDILSALINGGPARDIADYADGAQACYHWLARVRQSPEDDLRHLLNVDAIGYFVNDDEKEWEPLLALGWNEDLRQRIRDDVQAIFAQPKWRQRVERNLANRDAPDFYITLRAAKLFGIDTWPVVFDRQAADAQENNWYDLMQSRFPARIEQVLGLAESQLDLAAIASGPDMQTGVGPHYQQHGMLDFILQELDRFPGIGWRFIETGLRSPVIRNRHMALTALESWPPHSLPDGAHSLLETACQQEPDEQIRARLVQALAQCNAG